MRRAIVVAAGGLLALLFVLMPRALAPTGPGVAAPASEEVVPDFAAQELIAPSMVSEPQPDTLVAPDVGATAREAPAESREPTQASTRPLVTVRGQVVDVHSGAPVLGAGVLGVVRSPEHDSGSFLAGFFARSGMQIGRASCRERVSYSV